jgi:4-hydroxy-3-polyprenylbenzoate decarboxylase
MHSRIIIAITGASGAIYGLRALEILHRLKVETHLIISANAKITITQETDKQERDFESLANKVYDFMDLTAPIASGSYPTLGMMISPCSIKTLSAITNSYNVDLITRAADVCLKEGRPLVLMVRETPLHYGHLSLMLKAAQMGAILFPPVPAFYNHPQSIDDIITSSVGRALARLGIDNDAYLHWKDNE